MKAGKNSNWRNMQASLGIMEYIKIGHLHVSTYNPRVNPGNLDELILSIYENGLLQSLVVRPNEDHFEVIAGNRRLEACRQLGYRKILCHIVEFNDKEALEVSLTENIQRRSLHPLEEAEAFRKYVEDYGWGGITELAEKIGKSQTYVSKRLKLLNLPEDLRKEISYSHISPSVVEELFSLKDVTQIQKLGKIMVSQHMTLKETRSLVKMIKNQPSYEDDTTTYSESPTNKLRDESKRSSYRTFRKATVILRSALIGIDDVIGDIDENWILRETLMEHRRAIHELISSLIKARKKIDYSIGSKTFEQQRIVAYPGPQLDAKKWCL